MSNDKIVLKNSTEITLESSQGIGALNVVVNSKQEACALWGQFTSDNLKQVIIKNQDGLTVGKYQDMVLDHVTGVDKENGAVQLTFSLRSKTTEELLIERITSVESELQIHGGAIGDAGQAISDIVEGGVQ